jgi:hypothetical protein
MAIEILIEWWAYIHINGKLQVKRYFSTEDLAEATASPFVERIYAPKPFTSRSEAIKHFALMARKDGYFQ